MRKSVLVASVAGGLFGCAGIVGLGDPPDIHGSLQHSEAGDAPEVDSCCAIDASVPADVSVESTAPVDSTADVPEEPANPDALDALDVVTDTTESEEDAPEEVPDAGGDSDAEAGCPGLEDASDAPPTLFWSNGFETDAERNEWFFAPPAGFDYGAGVAHTNKGNAWVRWQDPDAGGQVWAAVSAARNTAGTNCQVSAWIAASSTLVPNEGYFNAWDNPPLHKLGTVTIEPGDNGSYSQYTFSFCTPPGQSVIISAGIWSIPLVDQWIRVDDVSMTCM